MCQPIRLITWTHRNIIFRFEDTRETTYRLWRLLHPSANTWINLIPWLLHFSFHDKIIATNLPFIFSIDLTDPTVHVHNYFISVCLSFPPSLCDFSMFWSIHPTCLYFPLCVYPFWTCSITSDCCIPPLWIVLSLFFCVLGVLQGFWSLVVLQHNFLLNLLPCTLKHCYSWASILILQMDSNDHIMILHPPLLLYVLLNSTCIHILCRITLTHTQPIIPSINTHHTLRNQSLSVYINK